MKRISILNKKTAQRAKTLGELGEKIAPFYLEQAGFESVRNLNDDQSNHPFADLLASRQGVTYLISVKTRNKFEARSGNLNTRYKLHERAGHADLIKRLSAKHQAVPAWLAIQIDGDRLSIYFGTVEQLGGNKGIPMLDDCLPGYECLADHEPHGLDIAHLRNTYETRLPASRAGQSKSQLPVSGRIFLHLCCEGWQRFGPFEWLSFHDSPHAIVDEAGNTIVIWDGHAWRTSDSRFEGYTWKNPTISIGPRRPNSNPESK
ncbi:MAG: hypothetical protein ACOYM3_02205 [Terrimicrobiaceae bacterium]